MSKFVLFVLLVAIPIPGSTQSDRAPDQPLFVSLIQLIATPEKYDDKTIDVIGFIHLEFEGDELYVHRSDFENGITKNGIWVQRNPNLVAHEDEIKDRYVIVVGTYSTGTLGHSSLTSGAITKITYAGPWPTRSGIQKWSK